MKIDLSKFGTILVSRPAGREALGVIRAYFKPKTTDETIELDSAGVKVMGPSWLDEVLTGLRADFGDRVRLLPTTNASVLESLKIIDLK